MKQNRSIPNPDYVPASPDTVFFQNGTAPQHEYAFKVFNGRVKVYIDGYIAFCFNQIDFKGFYSYKDDTSLYGLDLYLMNENGGATTIPVYFKTKEVWLSVLQLLDRNM